MLDLLDWLVVFCIGNKLDNLDSYDEEYDQEIMKDQDTQAKIIRGMLPKYQMM